MGVFGELVGDVELGEDGLGGGLVVEIEVAIDECGGEALVHGFGDGGETCLEDRDGLGEIAEHGVGFGDGGDGEGVLGGCRVDGLECLIHHLDGLVVSASALERGGVEELELGVVWEC